MDWPLLRALSYSKRPRSRFLELPQEIRDYIYELALVSEKPTVTFCLDEYQRDSYQEATQPPLTRVSRQVRRESIPIFYQANNFILHTENSKGSDTFRWLSCIEPRLRHLLRVSMWLRYVTLTNDRNAENGAIGVSMRRSKGDDGWKVDDEWKWITVTRKPASLAGDGKFLLNELNKLLIHDYDHLDTAEDFSGIMTDIKLLYQKEKMSY